MKRDLRKETGTRSLRVSVPTWEALAEAAARLQGKGRAPVSMREMADIAIRRGLKEGKRCNCKS